MVMLLIFSSTPSYTKDFNLTFSQDEVADICTDVFVDNKFNRKRNVTVSVYAGQVDVKDSLFGITLYLRFDSEKWYFERAFTTNTLCEPFDEGRITRDPLSENHIMGSIGTMLNTPSAGDLPLIKLQFTYLGDCPDSSEFEIEELSFTDECSIPYFKDVKGKFYADVKEGEYRYAKVEFGDLNKEFPQKGNISNSLIFDLPHEAKVETFDVTIDKSIDFEYNNFVANGSLTIEETIDSEENIVLKLKKDAESGTYYINYGMQRLSDEDFSHTVEAKISSINDCNCAIDIINTEQQITYTKSSVEETNEQTLCNVRNGFIEVLVPQSNIEVYDLQGNCSKYLNTDIISFDNKVNGLYFIIIKAQNKIEKIRYLNIK